MNRRKMKPLLIAAIIVVMVAMMGCAIVVMTLQDLKIGEFSYKQGEILDFAGNVLKETYVTREVISLQGIKNSPNQLAAQEWLEFEESYDVDGQLIGDAEAAGYVAPREYDAYFVYDQTMQDKVDEIAKKYGLKLAGRQAFIQEYQNHVFFDALGVEKLHHEDAVEEVEYVGGYFYACGNFNMEFYLTLPSDEGRWPREVLLNMRYNGKEYLDTVFASIQNMEEVEQWNYTTANGTDILIIMGDGFARFFCDREDAFLTSHLGTDYESDTGEIQHMTKADVEAIADALDFEVVPQKPDMEAAIELLQKSEQEHLAATAKDGYFGEESVHPDKYGYREFIEAGIAAAKHPEKNFFVLMDIDGNGVVDLLLGGEEQCGAVWTVEYGKSGYPNIKLLSWSMTEQELEDLNAAWPDMDKKPITEYFSE